MNKLLTNITGGFPFTLDDLRFQDDATRLAIADAIKTIAGDGTVILYGCGLTIAGTTVSVAEGAILWQGEIWHVFPHSYTVPNPLPDVPRWNFVTVNDAAGSKVFEDGITHQVYQVRKAVGSYLPLDGALGSVSVEDVPRLSDVENSAAGLIMNAAAELPGRSTPSRSIKRGSAISIDAGMSLPLLGNTFLHVASIVPVSHMPKHIIEGLTPGLDNVDPVNPHISLMYKIDPDGKIYVKRMVSTGSLTGLTLRLNIQYIA